MLISELARQVELSIDTIRFYEKQGLLDESHYERGENRYRYYTEAPVQRLNLIRMGHSAGFTLSEMRSLIREWESDDLSLAEKAVLLWRKIEQINCKIEELNTVKRYLQHKIEAMRTKMVVAQAE